MRATPVGLEQRLLARARRARLGRGDRIVVGFSGGRDSLALAAAMRRLESVLAVEPRLVHVDHQLREISGDEAARAVALASALGLACRVETAGPWPERIRAGFGMEDAAREARYRLLREAATAEGAGVVATAHHQTDQAETVLLHLLRGAGLTGAAGMAEWSAVPAADNISQEHAEPRLWRPFLTESRHDIDAYVAALGLDPINDPSNRDLALRRNALRRDILPRLEKLVPGAVAALARHAALIAADDAFLESLATEVVANGVDPGGRLAAAVVREQPPALRCRIVRQWLLGCAGPIEVSAERTHAVVALAVAGRGGRTIEICEGWTVELTQGMLRAQRRGGEGRVE